MKYHYIHDPRNKNLICCETHERVYVDYPTSLEIANIPNIVQHREREAIERYENNLKEREAKMTPLEALERVKRNITFDYLGDVDTCLNIIETALKDYEIVKSSVCIAASIGLDACRKRDKALEIIKNKKVAVDELLRCIKEEENPLEEYNNFAGDENSLTQEEFDLLKEVLL